MLSNALASTLARRNIHYGWVIVAVTFLTMLVVAGAVGAPGVFIGPLSQEFGWSTAEISAALAVRLALFGVMGPFAAAFMNQFGAPPPAAAPNFASLLATPLVVLASAVKTPVFWVLFATFFICGASTNGLIQTHFIAFCGDYGMVPVAAASVLAMMGIFDFFGTVGSGWLSDRYDPRWLLFWYYGLRGLSLLYLPHTDFTIFGLSGFAVFYGLDWIATVPPTVKLCADYFGERANIVFGWVFAGHQLGAASIALGAGVVRTELGSYTAAFIFAGVLCIAAAMLVLTLRRKPQPQLQPA